MSETDTKFVMSPDDLGIYELSQRLSIIMIISNVCGKVGYVLRNHVHSLRICICVSSRTLNKEQRDERGGGGPPTPARRAGN